MGIFLLLLAGAGALAAVAFLALDHGGTATRSGDRQPPAGGQSPVTLGVVPTARGPFFHEGAIGLSIETSELETEDLDPEHSSLVSLMRALGPGTLRVGGGSVDRAWWTSSEEPPPRWATNVVTPADLERLAGLASATGWRVVLSINLAHFARRRAADEARVAAQILGTRLRGFSIGNEPDVYRLPVIGLRPTSYGATQYFDEVESHISELRRAVPGVSFFGPDLHSQEWLPDLVDRGRSPFSTLTQHFYPTTYSLGNDGCEATPVPSAGELLSTAVAEEETAAATALVEAGHRLRTATAITETNSTGSCDTFGGPRTSPVFASALWSLDWILRAASIGVGSLQFHGYLGHCAPTTGSPICAPSYRAEALGEVVARPEYYGLFAARQLEGGRFVEVSARGSAPDENLTSYATVHGDGAISVALLNLDTRLATSVDLRIPGFRHATGQRLRAPSVGARRGIEFGATTLPAVESGSTPGFSIDRRGRGFHLSMPPASALILQFGGASS